MTSSVRHKPLASRRRQPLLALGLLGAVLAVAGLAAALGLSPFGGVGDQRSVSGSSPPLTSGRGDAAARPPGAAEDGAHSASLNPRWSHVLGPLLDRRALAWRRGDPLLLRSVYLPRSAALATDQAMLRDYLRRGLRVSGVRTQCAVVTLERQLPDRASLVVVDTLGPAVAHDAQGGAQPLPRDLPTRHRIRLTMTADGWRIAGISLA